VKKKANKVYYRDDDFLIKIENKIRDLGVSRGLRQMDLAFKCNDMDYTQINRIEPGKINFSVSNLILIATALEVSPKKLLPN
jgi:transcriptional regulator with XRE-family HTH domain